MYKKILIELKKKKINNLYKDKVIFIIDYKILFNSFYYINYVLKKKKKKKLFLKLNFITKEKC